MPTAATVPPQVGSGLLIKGAPKFRDFVIIDKSWKEKDDTQVLRTDDGDSNVFNYTFWRPGMELNCDWNIKKAVEDGATGVPAVIGDVVSEVVLSGTAKVFVVLAADTSEFGGMPLKQTVKLGYHVGFTPTVVED